jgi:flagellar motor switch protein FliM
MSVHSEEQIEPVINGTSTIGQQDAAGKPRSIQACNFRSAGRLSNENARALTGIHETFARHLTEALAGYVGTDVKVTLLTLDQLAVKDHVAAIPPFSYIAAFPLSAVSSTLILECDTELAFPIIELLLGGSGASTGEAHEFSEIEDEIMQGLMLLIARQTINAWGMPETSAVASGRIEPEALQEIFPTNERVTQVKFEVEVAGIIGTVQLAFPASLVSVLVKQTKVGQPQKKGALRFFPKASLRERILDCDVVVAADLPSMRVSVRDLIALQPGYVLKLRAPVRTPGMLTVGGREIFEAVPVRNGTQKAAQVGRRVQLTSWGKE